VRGAAARCAGVAAAAVWRPVWPPGAARWVLLDAGWHYYCRWLANCWLCSWYWYRYGMSPVCTPPLCLRQLVDRGHVQAAH